MYVPRFSEVNDEDEIRAMVAASGSAWLVTVGMDAVPVATLLPTLWRGGTVIAHMARANPHWRQFEDDQAALLIVSGPQAYISPSWYATKAEHGKVVPTWNYAAVHIVGTVRVHEDPEWLRSAVTGLTESHEVERERPWSVSDAPDQYIDGLLRGIVGIELDVKSMEAKAKLSQDRSKADQQGVVAGLWAEVVPASRLIAAMMDDDELFLAGRTTPIE